MADETLSDRTWNLTQLIAMMQPGSALKLSDAISIKRSAACWKVCTPYGNRQLALDDTLSILVLVDGKWPCTVCGKAFDPSVFAVMGHGRRTECKRCVNKRIGKWHQEHKDTPEYKAVTYRAQARYRERHREEIRARDARKRQRKKEGRDVA